MNNLFKGSLFFISGAAIASFITYKVVEKKFKEIADEEIASVKAMYERKIKKAKIDTNIEIKTGAELIEDVKNVDTSALDAVIKNNPYSKLVTDLGYTNNKEEEIESMGNYNIEIIPPEDFGEYGYRCESLTYYADKVLTYDDYTKVEDVEKIIGPSALNTFGEYEDDSVFVRNHDSKTDFEILLDNRRYSDVVGDNE